MGLSFYDEKSMEEAVESLHFGSQDDNSVSETGCISIVGQERPDHVRIQRAEVVETVDR
jgi:hypothetical protein